MTKIVLIACSKTKLPHKAKARDLYQGDLFKKSLEYSERILKPDKIFILSAKYGLINNIEKQIAPYEKTLTKMGKLERIAWADNVTKQLNKETNLKKDKFIILASANYREYLLPHIANYEIPMKGLTQGNQLKYLKRKLTK